MKNLVKFDFQTSLEKNAIYRGMELKLSENHTLTSEDLREILGESFYKFFFKFRLWSTSQSEQGLSYKLIWDCLSCVRLYYFDRVHRYVSVPFLYPYFCEFHFPVNKCN